jgi:hypothetical protein
MGAGLEMIPGDIAFKVRGILRAIILRVFSYLFIQSNFATIDPATGIVVRRRCDRNFENWGPPLCQFLSGMKLPSFPDHQIDVKYATEHR